MPFGLSQLRRALPTVRQSPLTAPPPGPDEATRMLWLLRGGADTASIAARFNRSEAEIYNAVALAREQARAGERLEPQP